MNHVSSHDSFSILCDDRDVSMRGSGGQVIELCRRSYGNYGGSVSAVFLTTISSGVRRGPPRRKI